MAFQPEPDFTCAICQRNIEMRWNFRRPSEALPPICLSCEQVFSEGVGKPTAGSMRDRRMVRQGVALTEALRTAAAHRTWGGSFGSA